MENEKKGKGLRRFGAVILYYAVIPLINCVIGFLVLFLDVPEWSMIITVPLLTVLWYVLLRKKIDLPFASSVNRTILLILVIIFTILMAITSGMVNGTLMYVMYVLAAPFLPATLVFSLTGRQIYLYLTIFLTYGAGFLVTFFAAKNRKLSKAVLFAAAAVILCLALDTKLYLNRPEIRYSGHGFKYMQGYSSTDFSDYMVYSEPSKLVTLDHTPELQIDDVSAMPVMDGAEACYPVYAAAAKAVYKDIAGIEKAYLEDEKANLQRFNGRIVTFTNTVYGFRRLIYGKEDYEDEIDLFFGARPSANQREMAKEAGVELEITPIGREAFVFFVEENNPVSDISSADLKAIYHGDIINWKDLGGKNGSIIAFQRPADSGSQSMMTYFMGDVSLMEPKSYEYVDSMAGVIKKTAEYANEAGAIGYSFRYFIEGLSQETGVKLLSVDGVAPTLENVENGTYPLTVDLCLITRKDDPNPNVRKMIDFMLSEDGQEIVRKTGYGGVKKQE